MIKKAANNRISFIKFLWQEFNPGSFIIGHQDQSLIVDPNNEPQVEDGLVDFKWLPAVEPRELSKVLNVKIPEDQVDASVDDSDDEEDEQIDNWQKTIVNSREKLISQQPTNKKIGPSLRQQAVKSLSATIEGIRARYQEQKWNKQSGINSMLAYLTSGALVTAIFLTILFPSAANYIAGANDRIAIAIMPIATNSFDQPLPILKFKQTQLAEYIRTNAFKFPVNHFNGQTTIILSGQDILGLPAKAEANSTDKSTQANHYFIEKIQSIFRGTISWAENELTKL
jgi:hypothetical protein